MPGMMDAYLAQLAGGTSKQPKKLSFGVASGGDGVKRPLSYDIAQRIMGQRQSGAGGASAQARPQTSNRPSKSSQSADGMLQGVMRSAMASVAKKK